MATTYLDVVNNVQRRLRENTTASVTTNSYSTLLGILVNDAKRKIEDTYPWGEFRTTCTHSVTSGDKTISLAGTTFRSKVLWGYNDTKSAPLQPVNPETNRLNNAESNNTVGSIWGYSNAGWTNDGLITLNIYPEANGSESLIFGVYNPPADLSADTGVVRIPPHVLEFGTMILAISERGEDGGQLFDEVVLQYNRALAQMMANEMTIHPSDFVWSNEEVWRSR